MSKTDEVMRKFETGATRHNDSSKLDFEGFLSPLALESYAEYLNAHRVQADGQIRDSDNWQKGIPLNVYMKSMWRHFFDVWKLHRGYTVFDNTDGHEVCIDEALCGLLFNAMGYLHEMKKQVSLGKAIALFGG